MKKRKIKYYEARQIAEAVAKKAFEHLTNPFENLLRQFLPMLPAPKENENGSSS